MNFLYMIETSLLERLKMVGFNFCWIWLLKDPCSKMCRMSPPFFRLFEHSPIVTTFCFWFEDRHHDVRISRSATITAAVWRWPALRFGSVPLQVTSESTWSCCCPSCRNGKQHWCPGVWHCNCGTSIGRSTKDIANTSTNHSWWLSEFT